MNNGKNDSEIQKSKLNSLKKISNQKDYSVNKALQEFEELKNIALNCIDKYGNPNIVAALRATENKAKIAGLYKKDDKINMATVVNMEQISIDGEQLKLNIGEDIQ